MERVGNSKVLRRWQHTLQPSPEPLEEDASIYPTLPVYVDACPLSVASVVLLVRGKREIKSHSLQFQYFFSF